MSRISMAINRVPFLRTNAPLHFSLEICLMRVTKGLIIADPWIGYILDGSKKWEMRSTKTSFRGPFALIRKGTGAISGIATLVDTGRALNRVEMIESVEKIKFPPS